jgi:transposase
MDYHHHSRLTIHGRKELVKKVIEGRLSLNSAAAEFKLGRQTAGKWVRRYRQGGLAALKGGS